MDEQTPDGRITPKPGLSGGVLFLTSLMFGPLGVLIETFLEGSWSEPLIIKVIIANQESNPAFFLVC